MCSHVGFDKAAKRRPRGIGRAFHSIFCAILAPLLDLDVAILSPECYFKINVLTMPVLFLGGL